MATTVEGAAARGAPRAGLVARVQKMDLRSTWQVAVGSFLIPIGVLVILISWYGSAHTPYVQQQIPYLVSGSFIGLGLMVVGGLLYWAHWLYRLYDQADLNHAAAMARQEQLMERLIEAVSVGGARSSGANGADALGAGGVGAGGAGGVGAGAVGAGAVGAGAVGAGALGGSALGGSALGGSAAVGGPGLVATATGANVHRSDCAIVTRHPVGLRHLSVEEATGRPMCRICHPGDLIARG